MKPITAAVLTAIVVAVARFQRGESFDFTDAIAGGFTLFILIVLSQVDREIGHGLAALIFVGALFYKKNGLAVARLILE